MRRGNRRLLREFEAKVAVFHDARRCGDGAASDEDWLGIAVAQRFQLAQPSGEYRRDLVERQLGMNVQMRSGSRAARRSAAQSARRRLSSGSAGGQGEADREGMSTETREEIAAGFDGCEQGGTVDGAAGSVRDAIFHADDERGLGGALDNARGEDADDAAMPAVAIDNEKTAAASSASSARRVSMAASARASVSRRSRLRRSSLSASSVARAASRVQKSSMISEATSMRPAALMRGARRKATSKPVSGFDAGSSCAAAKSARRPAPTGRRSSRRPSAAMTRFSPRSGTASAMVAMAAILRKLGSSLVARAVGIVALEQRLRELERDGGAAERFFRIAAAVLIGIEDGERRGNGIVGARRDDGR